MKEDDKMEKHNNCDLCGTLTMGHKKIPLTSRIACDVSILDHLERIKKYERETYQSVIVRLIKEHYSRRRKKTK